MTTAHTSSADSNAPSKGTTYEQSFPLSFPVARVFAALTREEELRRWFAEQARVDLRVGGAFAFWGRHTPWVATQRDSRTKITEYDASGRLSFDWNWREIPTHVRWSVRSDGSGSRLEVVHSVSHMMADFGESNTCHLIKDYWHLAVGNLREYLKSGNACVLPDYLASGDVVMSVEIDAPAAAVWNALTDPAEMDQWISESATVELRPGGRYCYGWKDEHGEFICPRRIIALEPGRRLHHDWHYKTDQTASTMWELEALGPARTRLTVRQVHVADGRERHGYSGGWGKFLVAIKAHLEREPKW